VFPLSTAENTRWKQKSTWEEAGCSGVSRRGLTENLSSGYARRLVEERLARKGNRQCLNVVGGLLDCSLLLLP
jgi:hypothetical protein